MKKNSHINVTIHFEQADAETSYDLRIPVHISIKQLLLDLMETLHISNPEQYQTVLKVKTKGMILADDDILADFPVTNGDILTVLSKEANRVKKG
ncbi:putative ubiquitin-like protein YukD [Gracilibacillus halotolerans]|uniref:Putative ubiquitin-like protein YukD n=1 Tax=Gracilibacillus halotolerans TaxID=74386 RepID=A0A841RP78_9BACI|nr:EsaB/YukD family protein [Gracilibacillus halotolerans]MBB6512975.1 putative ubiquitin-like protein YukD [Gracilibacillus halotolerans]